MKYILFYSILFYDLINISANCNKMNNFIEKSFKYNKINDIKKIIYSHYVNIISDNNMLLYDNFITKIKKCFKNNKYIAKYIYYHKKSESDISSIFIELITLLINPYKHIKDMPIDICYTKYLYNEYLQQVNFGLIV